MNPQPGWFPDPSNPQRLRWWEGDRWSDAVAENGVTVHDPLPGPTSVVGAPPRQSTGRRLPLWAWVLIVVAAVILLFFLSPVVALLAAIMLVSAIVALSTGRPTWLRFRSRGVAIAAAVAAALLLVVSGSVSAATLRPPTEASVAVDVSDADAASADTPTPTPTPVVTTRQDVVTEVIPFDRVTSEDATLPRGETRVTSGVDGERRRTYTVTEVDGVETSRELVEDIVTIQPITESTVVGTYDPPVAPPAPQAPPQQGGGCDPNYADGCVPIASDVDCAGGRGDGPAYFSGTARVVGSDVYGLDRNGDGIACNS